jgi:hypothetical protein
MTHTIAAVAEFTLLIVALVGFGILYRGLSRLCQDLTALLDDLQDSIARLETLTGGCPLRRST